MSLASLLKHSSNINTFFFSIAYAWTAHSWWVTISWEMRLSRDSVVPPFCTTTSELQPQSLHKLVTREHTQSPKSLYSQGWPSYHLPLEETHCRHFVIDFLSKLFLQPPPGITHGMHLYWTLQHHGHKTLQETEKCLTTLYLVKPTARKDKKNPKLIQEPQSNHMLCPKLCYHTISWA